MSAGLHPTIMFDLTTSTVADRRGSSRDREQRVASRRSHRALGRLAGRS